MTEGGIAVGLNHAIKQERDDRRRNRRRSESRDYTKATGPDSAKPPGPAIPPNRPLEVTRFEARDPERFPDQAEDGSRITGVSRDLSARLSHNSASRRHIARIAGSLAASASARHSTARAI